MSNSRRLLGLVLFLPVVASLIVGFGVRPASACSCAESALAENADNITMAFSGEQTSRVVLDETGDNGAVLTFAVDRVFKGDVGETISVRTHAQGSACGMDFSRVATSGVAVFTRQGQVSVNLCGSAVSVEDLELVFGDGEPPAATRSEGAEPGADALGAGPAPTADDAGLVNATSIAIASALAVVVLITLWRVALVRVRAQAR